MLPRLHLLTVATARKDSGRGLLLALVLPCLVTLTAGCKLIETQSVASNSGLAWFSNLTGAPVETGNDFDLELLRPVAQPVEFGAESLLEITVWDLFEPDKPHTFPIRVAADGTIDAPMLEPLSIKGLSLPQIEATLGDAYRSKELLLTPRILVRSLDESTVRITVAGAVARPGAVTLARQDASVHAAVQAAGGFKKDAGMHVGITRKGGKEPPVVSSPSVAASPDMQSAEAGKDEPGAVDGVKTASSTNDSGSNTIKNTAEPADESAAVEAVESTAEAEPEAAGEETVVAMRVGGSKHTATETTPGIVTWYDLARSGDRERLKAMKLAPGDTLTIRPIQRPVRIAGAVAHPGAYSLPANQTVNVWQALALAGGVTETNTPLRVTLIRPGVSRSGLRYTLHVKSYDQHPQTAPPVHEGDVLQVEATVEGRVKTAVGGLWKP